MVVFDNVTYKKVSISSFGSINVPRSWYVTDSQNGLIFSNKALELSDVVIYMFQFNYEKRLDEWYVINDNVGVYLSKGIDLEGKGGIFSNNAQVTPKILGQNDVLYHYYQLDLWRSDDNRIRLMIDSEYIEWEVVQKLQDPIMKIIR
jgi:hypothetical protein